MSKPGINFLSESEIEAIHNASLQVLEKTGIKIMSKPALDVLKKSGVKNFDGEIAHLRYIEQASTNIKGIQAYKPYNTFLKKGDLVCYKRDGGSHCDIVVDIRKGEVDVIGGNVSNSVTKTTINTTDDGRVDMLRAKKDYIAVLKPK